MNAALICFSDAGAILAQKLARELDADVHSTVKYAEKYGFTAHESIMADAGRLFAEYKALIFIGSCGIAVRCIAPHVRSKTQDPAVIDIDDAGTFVIPLLSGHIGGANALARRIAEALSAQAVITTATDVHGRFACDEWAARHGCALSSLKAAKSISAGILTENIPVCSDRPLPEALPAGLYSGNSGRLGIYIGIKTIKPYDTTLSLVPRVVRAGIGCRRGIAAENILNLITDMFAQNGLSLQALKCISSIDIKRDEAGLAEAADRLKVPLTFYSAEELNRVPGEFTESEFVRRTTGTGNVCERAAAAEGGKLILRKTARDGVTIALAVDDWETEF